jgi:beta-galactosidase/beta-glucuronidase
MFGCGNYPAFPAIRQSIHNECVANVGRLRHHPSIVIYAGNNEDYQVQEQFGLTYDYEDKDPESWLKSNFPARYLYEKVSACCTALSASSLLRRVLSSYPKSSRPRVRMYRTILGAHGAMG